MPKTALFLIFLSAFAFAPPAFAHDGEREHEHDENGIAVYADPEINQRIQKALEESDAVESGYGDLYSSDKNVRERQRDKRDYVREQRKERRENREERREEAREFREERRENRRNRE